MAAENYADLVKMLSEDRSEALNSLAPSLLPDIDSKHDSQEQDLLFGSNVVSGGEAGTPSRLQSVNIPISRGNVGIQNLSTLTNSMQNQIQNQDNPIVLVPGFSGWGRPLFGTINYWGGFQDLPATLAKKGYTVILVKIGPFSSNWERACEIWTQLRNINNSNDRGYDLPTDDPTTIGIDYGKNHPAECIGEQKQARTWRPILFGNIPDHWTWSDKTPVHFICHSQGGNTVRYLVELLKGIHQDMFPPPPESNFPGKHCQSWVKSVVTIGTPYRGTTVTDIIQDLLPPNYMEVLTRLVWSMSFDRPKRRIYDLQLDHWGFYRKSNESLGAMHARLTYLVPIWWKSNHHGLYDNSIAGVAELSKFAPHPSTHTYYFTMSFCATEPFNNRTLHRQDVSEFIALFPCDEVIDPFGLTSEIASIVLRGLNRLPFSPKLNDFASWFTDVANRHLGSMNYFSRIPRPGSQIPRPDVLPVIALFAYAMGGYQLDNQESLTLGGITSDDYQKNDGVVNTKSMIAPVGAQFSDDPFPGRGSHVQNMAATAKGKYWHLGENATIDHADQIGVFTSKVTANEVTYMYLLLAHVVTRLD